MGSHLSIWVLSHNTHCRVRHSFRAAFSPRHLNTMKKPDSLQQWLKAGGREREECRSQKGQINNNKKKKKGNWLNAYSNLKAKITIKSLPFFFFLPQTRKRIATSKPRRAPSPREGTQSEVTLPSLLSNRNPCFLVHMRTELNRTIHRVVISVVALLPH